MPEAQEQSLSGTSKRFGPFTARSARSQGVQSDTVTSRAWMFWPASTHAKDCRTAAAPEKNAAYREARIADFVMLKRARSAQPAIPPAMQVPTPGFSVRPRCGWHALRPAWLNSNFGAEAASCLKQGPCQKERKR